MRIEVKLAIIATILIVIGMLLAQAGTHTETKTHIEQGSLEIINTVIEIPPGKAYYKKISVDPDLINPRLLLKLSIAGGNNDIDLILEREDGYKIMDQRVTGYLEHIVSLTPGYSYTLILSNSFSIVTSKRVKIYATILHDIPLRETETKRATIAYIGDALFYIGIISLIAAIAIGVVRTARRTAAAFREGLRGK